MNYTLPTVSPDILGMALEYGSNAGHSAIQAGAPEAFTPCIVALCDLSPYDTERRHSIIQRIGMLVHHLRDPMFARFIQDDPDNPKMCMLDPVLVKAAAVIPFNMSTPPSANDLLAIADMYSPVPGEQLSLLDGDA